MKEIINNGIKGFKVFNSDWTCRGFKYEVGKTYEEDVMPSCCSRGFHFCKKLVDCFDYYSFDASNKVAEVMALGDIDETYNKCCTNKIKIVRELTWHEVLDIVNMGEGNTGNYNSGDYNSGDYNSGDWNSGNRNSGNRNSGDWNSGNCNSGDWNSGNWNSGNCNSGNCNSGDWNSGNCNSGNCNSGDCNSGNYSNGCFNTETPKIYMFNKPTDWTYRNWLNSDACSILNKIKCNPVEWVNKNDMTAEEKENNPKYKTAGGFLRKVNIEERKQELWNKLSDDEKQAVYNLPNFDADIFEKCTGIKIKG